MAKHDRLTAILEMLAHNGRLDVEEAAAELGVSPATIRRDLDALAQQELLTRTHGGAVANSTAYDLPLRYKEGRRAPEKGRIGKAAADLIEPRSVVGLNGGTTTTAVARELAVRASQHGTSDTPAFTLVTNALNIATELAVRPHLKIVVTSGVVRPQSYELIGPLATEIFEHLALDTVVLGVDAVDVDLGAMTHHENEASINRLMAARARKLIVVADSSKLDRHAFARICPIGEIDVLVTDGGATKDIVRRFTDAGVEVVRA